MIVVTPLDYAAKPLSPAQALEAIKGRAYGVREDIINGKRGMVINSCSHIAAMWLVEEV